MRKREYRIGPGAVSLMLLVVVVSMSVLGLLALISARGDYKLTDRAEEFAASEYNASAAAEYSLAQLDAVLAESAQTAQDDAQYMAMVEAALPEGMRLEGRSVRWEEVSAGKRTMVCAVEILPLGSEERFSREMFLFDPVGIPGNQ